MESLSRDIRFALRTLRRSPGFTIVAVLTLALAIGATTAVFSIVDAVILRPLPYPQPDRLVRMWEANDASAAMSSAWTNLLDWRRASHSFDAMAGYNAWTTTVLGAEQPLRVEVARVSEGFFRVMGVSPERGRSFDPEQHRFGAEPAAIVGHGFWQRELGGRTDLDTLRLMVSGMSMRVIGVMPAAFDFPAGAELWYPLELEEQPASRTAHNWRVVGRLKEGTGPAQAQEELSLITSRFPRDDEPDEYTAQRARVMALHDDISGPVRQPLLLLLGASVLVMLVGCTNLASTMLARGDARAREVALLRALGAERRSIVRRLFAESLLLALAGAAAGVLLAEALVRALPAVLPTDLPRMREIALSPGVGAFAAVVSLLAALLFGLLPALRVTEGHVEGMLRRAGRGSTSGRGPWRLLVAGEVALALLLLAGAGVLLRSFWRVAGVDPGFDPRGVLTMQVDPPEGEYGAAPRRALYYAELLDRVRQLPGIEVAGMAIQAPLADYPSNGLMRIDGGPQPTMTAAYQVADEDYFQALRIPLLQGRLFTPADAAGAPHVVLVNRTMAELAWPGQSPIGKRITGGGMDSYWDQPDAWATVVGVVGDIHERDLTRPSYPTYYFSYRQRADRARSATVFVRAARGAPEALIGSLRQAVRDVDPDVPMHFVGMDELVATSLGDRRFTMGVLLAFATLAVLLAALGIYGAVAYTVALRRREMGIRIALGAPPPDVLRMVLREALATVGVGLAVGLAVSLALARILAGLLYEVSPNDPAALAATAATLLAIATLASFIPARRAAAVDPLIAMRAD